MSFSRKLDAALSAITETLSRDAMDYVSVETDPGILADMVEEAGGHAKDAIAIMYALSDQLIDEFAVEQIAMSQCMDDVSAEMSAFQANDDLDYLDANRQRFVENSRMKLLLSNVIASIPTFAGGSVERFEAAALCGTTWLDRMRSSATSHITKLLADPHVRHDLKGVVTSLGKKLTNALDILLAFGNAVRDRLIDLDEWRDAAD